MAQDVEEESFKRGWMIWRGGERVGVKGVGEPIGAAFALFFRNMQIPEPVINRVALTLPPAD